MSRRKDAAQILKEVTCWKWTFCLRLTDILGSATLVQLIEDTDTVEELVHRLNQQQALIELGVRVDDR